MFHLMFVWGKSCALGWTFVLIVFCLFVFYLFPILVLRANIITMPELLEINLVSDEDNSLTENEIVLTLLRFFSLRNEIVKVI